MYKCPSTSHNGVVPRNFNIKHNKLDSVYTAKFSALLEKPSSGHLMKSNKTVTFVFPRAR